MKIYYKIHLFLTLLAAFSLSCNPFAPAIDESNQLLEATLGNPVSVDGFFKRFKSAYELRDTTMYGTLFTPDFTFTYYDPSTGQNKVWDRGVEMITSYKLFQGVQQINIDWNFYSQQDTTDTSAYIIRNFNLSIVRDASTVYMGTGRARMRLRRAAPGDPWKAWYWFDDSDF